MKKFAVPAILLAYSALSGTAHADLLGGTSVSASVGVGGTSVSASVGTGGGSTSASVGIGIGSGGSSVTADINSDTTGQQNGPASGSRTRAGEDDRIVLVKKNLLGMPLVASDGVILGRIVDVRPGGAVCPTFGISPSKALAIDHDRVWVQSNRCEAGESTVTVSVNSGTFLEQVRN